MPFLSLAHARCKKALLALWYLNRCFTTVLWTNQQKNGHQLNMYYCTWRLTHVGEILSWQDEPTLHVQTSLQQNWDRNRTRISLRGSGLTQRAWRSLLMSQRGHLKSETQSDLIHLPWVALFRSIARSLQTQTTTLLHACLEWRFDYWQTPRSPLWLSSKKAGQVCEERWYRSDGAGIRDLTSSREQVCLWVYPLNRFDLPRD